MGCFYQTFEYANTGNVWTLPIPLLLRWQTNGSRTFSSQILLQNSIFRAVAVGTWKENWSSWGYKSWCLGRSFPKLQKLCRCLQKIGPNINFSDLKWTVLFPNINSSYTRLSIDHYTTYPLLHRMDVNS